MNNDNDVFSKSNKKQWKVLEYNKINEQNLLFVLLDVLGIYEEFVYSDKRISNVSHYGGSE